MMARPAGFEPAAFCLEATQYKILSAASGVAYEEARLALELDRSWTENSGVNPKDGTNYLGTASAFTKVFLHLLAG